MSAGACAAVRDDRVRKGERHGPADRDAVHVYGGEVNSPLNSLIEQFNSTIGAEQNIRVKVELVSNSGSIHKSVLAAANSDPGAPSLPDMFVSYPKTVLALPDQNLIVDYRDYFSPEELGTFIPAFMEEG